MRASRCSRGFWRVGGIGWLVPALLLLLPPEAGALPPPDGPKPGGGGAAEEPAPTLELPPEAPAEGLAAEAQDPDSLEEALRAYGDSRLLGWRVSPALGQQAARAISDATDPDRLEALTRIALAAKAYGELSAAVVERVLAGGHRPGVAELLRALLLVPPEALAERLGDQTVVWHLALANLAERRDPELARPAIRLLARDARWYDCDVLLSRWQAEPWNHPRWRWLVKAVAEHSRPRRQVLEGLALMAAPVELEEDLSAAMSRLVERDPRLAEWVFVLIQDRLWGSGGALIRVLTGLPGEHGDRARHALIDVLEEADDQPLIAAIEGAARLGVIEAEPLIHELAAAGSSVDVQRAAIRAVPRICRPSAATIDLLIGLLHHEALGEDAYRCLVRKTAVKLPLRQELWQRWRRKQDLAPGVVARGPRRRVPARGAHPVRLSPAATTGTATGSRAQAELGAEGQPQQTSATAAPAEQKRGPLSGGTLLMFFGIVAEFIVVIVVARKLGRAKKPKEGPQQVARFSTSVEESVMADWERFVAGLSEVADLDLDVDPASGKRLPLGELAVAAGYLKHEKLEMALRMQSRRVLVSGKKTPLGEILVRNGFLSPDQLFALLQKQESMWLVCPSCSERFYLSEVPHTPGALPCAFCGAPLQVVVSPATSTEAPAESPTEAFSVTLGARDAPQPATSSRFEGWGTTGGGKERFGDLAVRAGFLTQQQLKVALRAQIEEEAASGKKTLLGEILIRQGLMTSSQVFEVLNHQWHRTQKLERVQS